MLDVLFVGVGEACDENLPNTSVLIHHRAGSDSCVLLLDCGFTVPPRLWQELPDAAHTLDGVWLSHFHGDHTMGLPVLLLRLQEEGRDRPLLLLGQKGLESFCRRLMDVAYPGFYEKLEFPLAYCEVEPGRHKEFQGLGLSTALTEHSQRNLGLKIQGSGSSVYYSGDGKPGPDCARLAAGCALIIHEAFHAERDHPGHGTAVGAAAFAKAGGASVLALVHVQRGARGQVQDLLPSLRKEGHPLEILLPLPGNGLHLA